MKTTEKDYKWVSFQNDLRKHYLENIWEFVFGLQIELKDIESILNQMLGKERDMLFLEEIIGHVKYAVLKQLKFTTKNMLNTK